MKTVREALADEDVANAVQHARAFIEAGRPIPSSVVDIGLRACWTSDGRKALRALRPPRELVLAIERGGVRL